MRICSLFDEYRDGELNSIERRQFESHLAVCEDCRIKMSLLNNLVCILKRDETEMPAGLAVRIVQKAFRKTISWDALVVSWIQPRPALAALALVLALFSFLWLVSDYEHVNAYSEYETLMQEADAMNLEMSFSDVRNDSELVIWLEQEGSSQ